MKKLLAGRRVVAAAIVAGALAVTAAVVVPTTLGFFDASTSNPNNSFAAGTLTMTNSKTGVAIVTGTNMKPGDVKSGSVTLTNSGTLAATMTLSESGVVTGVGSPVFSSDLQLVVTDVTRSVTLYTGNFDGLGSNLAVPGTGGSQWAASEAHILSFTVTFPNAGTNSDNQYQGTSAAADFSWHGVQ